MLSPSLAGIGFALLTILPFAWKWELGLRRVAAAVCLLGLLSSIVTNLVGRDLLVTSNETVTAVVWSATVLLALFVLLYRFYRDPDRAPPEASDVVVSPADGVVRYVHKSEDGCLPVSSKNGRQLTLSELTRTPFHDGNAVVVGIGMSLLDVHVNRAPISGRVLFQRHFPGCFCSLKLTESVFKNERATTIFGRDDIQVAVVQIASRLVRQIVVRVREGQAVSIGDRMGGIRLGSQVDVVLPARDDIRITVEPGAFLKAGESVIAVLDATANKAHT